MSFLKSNNYTINLMALPNTDVFFYDVNEEKNYYKGVL